MFRKYTPERVLSILDDINIERIGNTICTTYKGNIINTTNVSSVYEVFDFPAYAKEVVNKISENGELDFTEFNIDLTGGIQRLIFNSQPVTINGESYVKRLYVINSTNRLRALQIRYSLVCNEFEFINKLGSVYKKHYTGVTDYAHDNVIIEPSIFDKHIQIIKDTAMCNITMYNLQEIIMKPMRENNSDLTSSAAEQRFNRFCVRLANSIAVDKKQDVNKQLNLNVPSDYFDILTNNPRFSPDNTFYVGAYTALKSYLSIYKDTNCFDLIRESERIHELTGEMQRNKVFDIFGI